MNWFLDRLREGSTWRGLVWLLAVGGIALSPEQTEAIIVAGMALAGLLGVFLKDRSRDGTERTRETDKPALPPIDLVGKSEAGDSDPAVYKEHFLVNNSLRPFNAESAGMHPLDVPPGPRPAPRLDDQPRTPPIGHGFNDR